MRSVKQEQEDFILYQSYKVILKDFEIELENIK